MVLELRGMLVLVLVCIRSNDGVGLAEVIGWFSAEAVSLMWEGPDASVGEISGSPFDEFEEIIVLHVA